MIRLHVAVFLWGFTGVLGRAISLNEGLLVWYRVGITVLSLLALLLFTRKLEPVPVRTRQQFFANGMLLALHWVFFYGSVKLSNVSIALTCLSSTGLFTAVLGPFINRTKPAIAELLLGLLGMAGIILIFHFDPHYKWGIVTGIVAALLSCVYTIVSERQVAQAKPLTVLFYQLLGGWIGLTCILPFYLQYRTSATLLPAATDWLLLLVMSWVCTIVSMLLALQSLKKLSAFTQNLTINLEPVYGIALAFLVYQENRHLSPGFFAGFGLIALAVALQMIRIIKKPSTA